MITRDYFNDRTDLILASLSMVSVVKVLVYLLGVCSEFPVLRGPADAGHHQDYGEDKQPRIPGNWFFQVSCSLP